MLVASLLTGCAAPGGPRLFGTVRQQDLDAWVGVPVIALDTHSFFQTIRMVRTITDNGIEIRNYSNKIGTSGCDNIFYIRDGEVIEYKPVGQCYTDEFAQPEPGYEKFAQPRVATLKPPQQIDPNKIVNAYSGSGFAVSTAGHVSGR